MTESHQNHYQIPMFANVPEKGFEGGTMNVTSEETQHRALQFIAEGFRFTMDVTWHGNVMLGLEWPEVDGVRLNVHVKVLSSGPGDMTPHLDWLMWVVSGMPQIEFPPMPRPH